MMANDPATDRAAHAPPRAGITRRLARLADGAAMIRFTRMQWMAVAALIAAILLPSLFLPLGPDEAMFLVSGQKILQGAVHYRDIIDIKPPLIYHLYALGALLFGTSEIAVRLFDVILQGITCWLMIGLLRRATRNDLTAALAPVLYLLLYIGQGYGAVGQSESYAGLLGVVILRLLLFGRGRRAFIAVGAVAGVLALLKFTLGIILAAALLAELVVAGRPLMRRLRNCVWMLAGFAAVAALFVAYITATGALANFMLVNQFLRGYARIELGSASAWLRNLLRGITTHFSDNYSIALFIATAAGMGMSIFQPGANANDDTRDGSRRMLRVAALAFVLLLVSVIAEGKFYAYHFSRIYPFGAMLAAVAIVRGLGWTAAHASERAYGVVMWCLIVLMLGIFGPLPRYGWQCVPMVKKIAGGDAAVDTLYDRMGSYYPRSELRSVGAYVAQHRAAGDRMFAASSIGALVYYFAGTVPDASIYHSVFYMARFAPIEFKNATRAYLLDGHPRFIVMQINDTTADISGERDATSASALRALPGIDSLLTNNYRVVMRTKFFEVMEMGVSSQ